MTVTDRSDASLAERAIEEIRVAMTRRRVSGRELARRLGVSQPWVSYRLTGETPITLADVEKIAAALDVPVSVLLPLDTTGAAQ